MYALALLLLLPAQTPALAQKTYIRVLVDVGTKVYIDGDKANMKGGTERTFQTPFLLQGHYYYAFKFVDARGGERSRRVYFHPGESITVDDRRDNQ